MLLSFDTSLPVLSVAIVDDGLPLGSLILEGAGSRNEKLLPAVDWLLREVDRSLDDVSRIVVTRGPGSFTGVRIGLATAQGLAFSREIPLYAMSTHEAVMPEGGSGMVIGDAGRGEVYRTLFEEGVPVGDPDLVPRDHPGVDEAIDIVAICRLTNVALLAALRVAGGRARDEWADATPIYIRRSAAEEKLEQASQE